MIDRQGIARFTPAKELRAKRAISALSRVCNNWKSASFSFTSAIRRSFRSMYSTSTRWRTTSTSCCMDVRNACATKPARAGLPHSNSRYRRRVGSCFLYDRIHWMPTLFLAVLFGSWHECRLRYKSVARGRESPIFQIFTLKIKGGIHRWQINR